MVWVCLGECSVSGKGGGLSMDVCADLLRGHSGSMAPTSGEGKIPVCTLILVKNGISIDNRGRFRTGAVRIPRWTQSLTCAAHTLRSVYFVFSPLPSQIESHYTQHHNVFETNQ
jgi:hypothetical protein